jgi:vancomycin permeability regulator SanA
MHKILSVFSVFYERDKDRELLTSSWVTIDYAGFPTLPLWNAKCKVFKTQEFNEILMDKFWAAYENALIARLLWIDFLGLFHI